MGNVIRPGSVSSSAGSFRFRPREFFFVSVIRQHGLRGLIALIFAAVVAFLPMAILLWYNAARLTSVVASQHGPRLVVKAGRLQSELELDEPGETGILQIVCEVPTSDGWQNLLREDDPRRYKAPLGDTCYVRRECIYLRKARGIETEFTGRLEMPFGLLGSPPISVWVPEGDYEIAVVHEAPSHSSIDAKPHSFPLVTVIESCRVEGWQKVVHRIRLPHYNWGPSEPIGIAGQEDNWKPQADLSELNRAMESISSIPTPGGFILSLPEPQLMHSEDHGHCAADFQSLQSIPREWTRDQLATLRNWLPATDVEPRAALSKLVDALLWRESLQGWFTYALAGIAGLVFTKWGTLAILERRQRTEFPKLIVRSAAIFVIAATVWSVLR